MEQARGGSLISTIGYCYAQGSIKSVKKLKLPSKIKAGVIFLSLFVFINFKFQIRDIKWPPFSNISVKHCKLRQRCWTCHIILGSS